MPDRLRSALRLAFAAALLLGLGSAAGAQTPDVPRPTPAETAAFLAATPGAQVLDVRRPAEIVLSGRLAGAVAIDVSVPGFADRARAALDPDRPVVVYCRSGARAGRAAEVLAGLGFGDLRNAGGFDDLEAAGLPTVGGDR